MRVTTRDLENLLLARRLGEEADCDKTRREALAVETCLRAEILGPSWYVAEFQVDDDALKVEFNDLRLVGINRPGSQVSSCRKLNSATLSNAALRAVSGHVRWLGSPPTLTRIIESGWLENHITRADCSVFSYGPRPQRDKRFRLVRKALRDPELFLADSQQSWMKTLGRFIF